MALCGEGIRSKPQHRPRNLGLPGEQLGAEPLKLWPAALEIFTVDFLPGLKAGDSFYAAHGDASAIGWVGASQPAATARVDLCAAPRPF